MKRCLFIFLVTLFSLAESRAQQLSGVINEAYQLYKEGKYEAALKKYEYILNQPLQDKSASYLGSLYYFLGRCAYELNEDHKAITAFGFSADYYHNAGEYENVKDAHHHLDLAYKKAGKRFYQYHIQYDSSAATNEIFFPVKMISRSNADTMIVKIDGGYNLGVFEGASGNIMLSYNGSRRETQKNDFVGKARVLSVTLQEAVVELTFFDKLPDYKKNIQPGDLVVLKLYDHDTRKDNIFYNLSALDILFTNGNVDTVITKEAVLNNTDKDFEDRLLSYYLYDIRSFYDSYLHDKTDTVFNTPYKKGRFKGRTMKDAFRYAEKEDLYAFFHFVRSFPGKYMGRAWKINETYATWVLNNMPEGEVDKQWMLPFIKKTPLDSIDVFTRKFSAYLLTDSLITYRKGLDVFYNEKKYEECLTLCNKLYRIANLLGDAGAKMDFIYYRSYIYQAQNNIPNALKDAKTAYALNAKLPNVISNLAYLYAKLEKYDSCFYYLDPLIKANPDRYDIKGNLGWYKMLAGKWDEATTLCKEAYLADTNSYSYAVNYGHTFLLSGNNEEARKYYHKSLEHLYYPTDYIEGPKKDFELFITKGWKRVPAATELDWMDEQYQQKYSYITRGNVVWDEAKKLYDAKKYKKAADKWKEYIAVFNGMKEPPIVYIHNAYTWIGSSYEEAGEFAPAEKNYLTALQMAKDTAIMTDKLSGDYKRLFNLYQKNGKTSKAREFKLMYDVENQKQDDAKARPRLFLIAVEGQNTLQPESKNNARTFFETIQTTVKNSFDSLYSFYISNNKLSKQYLLSLLDSIKTKSRAEDVLMFYYTGTVSSRNKENFYLLKESATDSVNNGLSEYELVNAVKNIGSQRKLIISDVPAPGIMARISEGYNVESYALNEVMFICPGVLTPVKESTGLSAFTEQLSQAVTELSKQNKFTAKDLLAKTSEGLGVNKYYLPVLSFAFAKDFVLYRNQAASRGEESSMAITRAEFAELKEDVNNSPVAEGKNYALLVATDNYKDYQKLNNAVYDATELAKYLKKDFGFDTDLLINATKDEMENKLIEYRDGKIYNDNDQLFIYFAGHGIVDKKENMGYLVASDSRKTDTKKNSFFSYSDLFGKYLKNIKCKRIFLVLDACHAGTFFDQSVSRGEPPSKEAREILKRNASGKKHFIGISSGSDEPVSDGNPGEHSPFAKAFMNNLINQEFMTAGVLVETLKANLPSNTMVRGGQFNTGDVGGQFIFELKTKASVTPQIRSANSNPTQ